MMCVKILSASNSIQFSCICSVVTPDELRITTYTMRDLLVVTSYLSYKLAQSRESPDAIHG